MAKNVLRKAGPSKKSLPHDSQKVVAPARPEHHLLTAGLVARTTKPRYNECTPHGAERRGLRTRFSGQRRAKKSPLSGSFCVEFDHQCVCRVEEKPEFSPYRWHGLHAESRKPMPFLERAPR